MTHMYVCVYICLYYMHQIKVVLTDIYTRRNTQIDERCLSIITFNERKGERIGMASSHQGKIEQLSRLTACSRPTACVCLLAC